MKVNDKDVYWGELFLRVINDLDRPMLMFKEEKEAVKHALELMLQAWEKQKTGSEENNWIPYSEQLPKKEGTYFITIDKNGERVVGEDFFYFRGDGTPCWYLPDNVVAWMPLPQPYKK